jgi:hypothetical protein
MLKRRIVEAICAFALFTVLMIAGTDTIESIYEGIWHVLSWIGLGRTVAEMISACTVLWAIGSFARGSVQFFSAELYLLKDKE